MHGVIFNKALKLVIRPELRFSKADINIDGAVDFLDYAILATSWQTKPGDANWNPDCDISEPNDDVIEWVDLPVLSGDWLATTGH